MKRAKKTLLIWLTSLLIAGLFTFPGITTINTKIIGDHGDGWQNIWNINHIKNSIEHKTNLYHTDKLHYPNGTALYLHTLSPALNSIGSLLYVITNNIILSYNLLVILILSINPVISYFFLRKISSSSKMSLIGAYVFSFSPYVLGHALGHINLIFVGIIPLVALTFLNIYKKPIFKNYLWHTCALCIATFSSLYYLIFSLLLIGAYTLYKSVELKKPQPIIKAILTTTPFAILTSPFWIQIINQTINTELVVHNPEKWSADILAFFTPSSIQSIGVFFTEITNNFSGNNAEGNLYLGITVMLISLFTLFKNPNKKTILAGIGAFITATLALGMHLHINGTITNIPLPYNLLYKTTPLIEVTGVPMRFTIITLFFLAIIISESEKLLSKKKIIIPLITICIALEFITIPFKTYQHPNTEFYTQIQNQSDSFTILDLHKNPTATLYYQTIHNKPIIGGYISKQTQTNEDFLKNNPAISPLWKFTDFYTQVPQNTSNEITPEIIDELKKLHIKYIIFENNPHDKEIIQNIPLQKIFEDQNIIVLHVN